MRDSTLDKDKKARILIIKLNKIGDVLLTSPLFANLKAYFKECEIDILVNSGTEGLLDSTLLHKIHILKRPKNFLKALSGDIALIYELQKRKYNLIISLNGGDRAAFFAFVSGVFALRVGFMPNSFWAKNIYHHKMPFFQGHNIESNLEALRILGIPIITKKVSAKATKSDKLERLPENFIHCHFFSDWSFKWLSLPFCAKIIDTLKETYNLQCVCTASPNKSETQALKEICKLSRSNPITFNGDLTLSEVSFLNSKALAFIGVDTAIMHLSAANGIPTFAFFGPSLAFLWGPWDNDCSNSAYEAKGGIQKMGKHCIYQESMPCVPCGKAGCDDSQRSDCLNDKLNEQEALNTLHSFLAPLISK